MFKKLTYLWGEHGGSFIHTLLLGRTIFSLSPCPLPLAADSKNNKTKPLFSGALRNTVDLSLLVIYHSV